jgi:hypothetical protein
MLSRRSAVAGGMTEPNPSHLLECVSAATSTIAIFDLFCKTFGDRRCVLSLSYSVYIAASIFLLQVQANLGDSVALRRLEYCVSALNRVKTINPGNRPPFSLALSLSLFLFFFFPVPVSVSKKKKRKKKERRRKNRTLARANDICWL